MPGVNPAPTTEEKKLKKKKDKQVSSSAYACGDCDGCKAASCGSCSACLDKSGKKQKCELRICEFGSKKDSKSSTKIKYA